MSLGILWYKGIVRFQSGDYLVKKKIPTMDIAVSPSLLISLLQINWQLKLFPALQLSK